MKINSIWLGMWVINIITVNWLMFTIAMYPKIYKEEPISIMLIVFLGLIGIIINGYNTFNTDK